MATYPKRDTWVAPDPPHHGWLGGTRKSAWKALDGDEKIVKVECRHTRPATGRPARAIARGEEAYLREAYAVGLINPCNVTKCPAWAERQKKIKGDE